MDGGIRIYLRLRPPVTAEQSSLMSNVWDSGNQICDYEVEHEMDRSVWKLHVDKPNQEGNVNYVDHTKEDYHFSFRRVLEPSGTQEQVFNVVAKDCVQSVLDGYNSTIFAYGQTGSGKTFSITGGTESYEDRGLIPRSLAMIYEETGKRKDINWTISLSYLQIYNDKGQDLLNHGKDAQRLEDLPNVTIHEGEEEIVLKNLEQHYSPTLSDALSLLFLGDTNRLYCETPMNKTSSRSHCVFMISLEAREVGSSVVRHSKLNLVDLAGSERVSKTGVEGVILNEAKYINLSLHYLEHVIISLSEQAKGRRDHVPYRNSFMTMVLRDSLGANCRTSMLATVHTVRSMVPETISTCQFAQRVALIRQNAHVNEETDPVLLVRKLKEEIVRLKDQLAFAEKGGGGSADRVLTSDEHHMCEMMVDTYLRSSEPDSRIEGFDGDLARIYDCFAIMKEVVLKGGGVSGKGDALHKDGKGGLLTLLEERTAQLEDYKSQVDALQVSLQQKENEMTMLVELLQKTNGPKTNASTQTTEEGDEGGIMHTRLEGVTPSLSVHTSGSMRNSSSAPLAPGQKISTHWSSGYQQSGGDSGMDVNGVSGSSVGSTGTGTTRGSGTSFTGSTPFSSHPETALALAKVQEMGEKGKLSGAQVTAVTSFLQEKEDYLREAQHVNPLCQQNSTPNANSNRVIAPLVDEGLLQNRAAALELFKQSYKGYEKVESMKSQLKTMYEVCKSTGLEANVINERIKQLKKEILRFRAERAVEGVEEVSTEEQRLLDKLREEKQVFTSYIDKVKKQKEEIQGIEAYLQRSKDQLGKHFEDWLQTRQRQVQLALQVSSPSSVGGGRASGGSKPNEMISPTAASTRSSTLSSSTVPLFQPSGGGGGRGSHPVPVSSPPLPAPRDTLSMSAPFSSDSLRYPQPPSSAPARNLGGSSSSRTWGEVEKKGASRGRQELGSSASASWNAIPSPPFSLPCKWNSETPASVVLSGNKNERKATEEVEHGTSNIPMSSTHVERGNRTKMLASPTTVTNSSGRGLPSRLQPISPSIPLPASPTDSSTLFSMTTSGSLSAPSSLLYRSGPGSPSPTGSRLGHASEIHTNTAGATKGDTVGGSHPMPNPYAPFYPQLRSTGDASADQELAALYTAREALRKKFTDQQ